MTQTAINLDLLGQLTAAPGLPGRETEVARIIQAALPRRNWTGHVDRLGNVVARHAGRGRRLMLVAHMDEVGLLVRRITPDGFLRVERMGGMGVHALPGSRLSLWTDSGPLSAHVGLLPQHLAGSTVPDLAELYIDIGACSAAEAAHMGARVGDGLTWHGPLETIGASQIRSKALDDRLGCLVLLALAERVAAQELDLDLTLAFIVQEETMLMGGMTVVNAVKPDVVIGVDGTLAFDTPDLEDRQSDLRIGAGPALKWMDTVRGKQVSYVPTFELAQAARRLAETAGIPLQPEIVVGLSTALSPVPYAAEGIETLALSLPIRYHHSPVETADTRDVVQMIELLVALLPTLAK